VILTWKLTDKSDDRRVYTSQPGGDYTLTGVPAPGVHDAPRSVSYAALRLWSLAHKGVEIATPERLSHGKRLAQRHHETELRGAPSPRHAATEASLSRRIRHAIEDAYATRRTGHIGDHAAELADIVIKVLAEPWPGIDLADCTHADECPVHPDARQVHNFDASAADVLGAVRAAVLIRHKFDEDDVREIAARYGVEVRR